MYLLLGILIYNSSLASSWLIWIAFAAVGVMRFLKEYHNIRTNPQNHFWYKVLGG